MGIIKVKSDMLARLRRIAARALAMFRDPELSREFDEELESHIAMLTEDNVRGGMTPEDARRAAVIRTGAPSSLAEEHRETRGLPVLDSLLQDLRFALRLIARDKWSSAAAIVTLGLGIGANATGFTIVNAAFFRGLPFEESGRLHIVSWQVGPNRNAELTPAEFNDLRTQYSALDLSAYTDSTMNVSDDLALPEQVLGTRLTANTFGVLRQKLLLGRDFTSNDDHPGAEPVVIIGHDLWKNRYAADPAAIGRTIRVNGSNATIVGVMPRAMQFPENSELWTPLMPAETQEARTERSLNVLGRLKDGKDAESARAELNGIATRLKATDPEGTRDFVNMSLETLTEAFVGGTSRLVFTTVMAAVCFVLLIACANIANLLLSRSASRAREMALRMSIGATRGRLVRQLLMESVVLGVLGGGLGLLIAPASVQAFDAAMAASGKPYWIVFTLDYAVFAYVAAICLLSAVVFGLAPALHVSKTNGLDVLKEGGRGVTGSLRVRWFSHAMVVGQISMTVVLLAGAGFMIKSFARLYSLDIGVDARRLVSMNLELPQEKYATADSRRAFFRTLSDQVAAVPGVEAASVTTGVPPLDGGERLAEPEADSTTPKTGGTWVSIVKVGPQFFSTLDRSVRRGRDFQDTDGEPGLETVIINESLAASFFSGQDPIGRKLRFLARARGEDKPAGPWRTVVGVSAPIRQGSHQDAYLGPVAYLPYAEDAPAEASLVFRSSLPLAAVTAAVRKEVQGLDPDQPVARVQTVQQAMDADRWSYRIFGTLFGILAVVALTLSAVGLYGVIAYSVTQRTQEIGVRIAVGARRSQVSWLILRGGLKQLALGLPLGLLGALALGGAMERVLVEGARTDLFTLGVVTTVLALVSLGACLLPAWRATRVDPVVALRAD
jgi:putative ABC transport system permease protein